MNGNVPEGSFHSHCKAQHYMLRNYLITVQGDLTNKEWCIWAMPISETRRKSFGGPK